MSKSTKQQAQTPPIPAPPMPVEERLDAARDHRHQLQAKRYKDSDDLLKLLALDVKIGNLLLEIEESKP